MPSAVTSSPGLPRRAVTVAATVLFGIWLTLNFQTLTAEQNGGIRFGLGLCLALLILLRGDPAGVAAPARVWLVLTGAVAGVGLSVVGVVFNVHQAVWLGLLVLLFAVLRWSLAPGRARALRRALFLLYWMHPLPSVLFGPLQIALQRFAVRGAEWLLHLLNVRVWADGMVLRAGMRVFEVPAWCSGMRTGTTVLLLAIGLGWWRGLPGAAVAALAVGGLLQALGLNILRIATLVILAPGADGADALRFLHHSGGVLVVIAVLLLCLEIRWLEDWLARRNEQRAEIGPDPARVLDEYSLRFRRLRRWGGGGLGVALLLLALGTIVFRSRPAHRVEMLKGVSEALRDGGQLEDAWRVADRVRRLAPRDVDWRLTVVRLLILRGQYEQALRSLDEFDDRDDWRTIERHILQAYTLMALKRADEAAALVETLPESVRRDDPRVAMIMAEMGMFRNQPRDVTAHLLTAARWRPNVARVRALYPYLRLHRQWNTIASTDLRAPFADPAQAFAAIEAYMNLDRTAMVATLTLDALRRWPGDPRLLEPLFFMTLRREGGEWETRFSELFGASVDRLTEVDVVYGLLEKAFQIARPDLAWKVYDRIARLDPGHPALDMILARYGHQWFAFRQRFAGLPAPRAGELLDTRAFFILGRRLPGWRGRLAWVPWGDALSREDRRPVRQAALERALLAFQARHADQSLSLDMSYEYVRALEMNGDLAGAATVLDDLTRREPGLALRNRVFLSEIQERAGDWPGVYETLREYPRAPEEALQLAGLLRLCAAQMNLRLGLGALRTARLARRLYPDAPQAIAAEATAQARHDSHEQALFTLSAPRLWYDRNLDYVEAESLYRTERFADAQEFCRAALLPLLPVPRETPQQLFLPPAELAAMWHRVMTPSRAEFERNAARLRANLDIAGSPFLRGLLSLWLAAYADDCAPASADPARWAAAGRDDLERGLLLHQLTLLQCYAGRLDEARTTAEAAVAELPDHPQLWRALISLSGVSTQVVARARAACPDDAEIWLAELVARTQTGARWPAPGELRLGSNLVSAADADWALASMRDAVARRRYPAGALTRAGDYLLRGGLTEAAGIAAREAVAHARGLLPAYILGIKCALIARDRAWAESCTRQAIEVSLRPLPVLYQRLVLLRADRDPLDTGTEMIEALKNLRRAEPENPLWPQMLGYIYLQRGGWEITGALYQMTVAMEQGATNRLPVIVSAEAARLMGNRERAADILREGLHRFPGDVAILNNLAYVLSADQATVPEALALLPGLLERAGDDPRVLDTAIGACVRARDFERADTLAARLLAQTPPGGLLWFRARLYQAEILQGLGRVLDAQRVLDEILKQSRDVPNEEIMAAHRLMNSTQEALRRGASNAVPLIVQEYER